YQSQAQAGGMTLAAEFKGHSIPTMQGTLTTEDYIIVELGVFGAADAHVKLSADEFSLRVNDKKSALASQPFGLVLASTKDPEYEPPVPASSGKSKTSMTGGGGQQEKPEKDAPPPPIPLEVQRAMAQRVRKAAL